MLIEVEIPKDWKHFRMPPALNDRLQELLDKQDEMGKLSRKERREAEALVTLAEVFSLMKVRAACATKNERTSNSRRTKAGRP
jgi:hypothetical protein